MNPLELMTTAEVAVVLRCTPRTLWNWRAEGRLTPVRVGRRWLHRRQHLRRLCGHAPDAADNYIRGSNQINVNGIQVITGLTRTPISSFSP